MKPTINKFKLLLDYTEYLNNCVSDKRELSKDTIRDYLKEDYYHKSIVK